MDTSVFLKSLTVVLCVAAVTTVLFQRLRQPVVLGYILAGLIVGPYVPIPLVADRMVVQTLSELGVILLMFSLGLDFSFQKLVRVGPTAGLTAVIESSIMFWLGFAVGRAFEWTPRECIFTGAIVAISSTTIIAKAFEERAIKGRFRELVVGILIAEDLIAILLLAVLTAVSFGEVLSADMVMRSAGRLGAFLAVLVTVGLLIVPRFIRAVDKIGRSETTLITSIGICFAVALLTYQLGYSVALGAFIAGSLVSESGEGEKIRPLIRPVRDMFVAIFFVSVGMLIDPGLVLHHWPPVVVLIAVVLVGKVLSVSVGAFLTGNGTRTSVQAGMSLAQIGEFSFIIAALGVSLKASGDFLFPVAVAVSAFTTLTTPAFIRASGPAANFVDRKLPKPLQTFAALYGGWIEQLRTAPGRETFGSVVRRLIKLLLVDALLLAGLVIVASMFAEAVTLIVSDRLSLSPVVSRWAVIAAVIGLAIPFGVGILRIARRLGMTLAETALPKTEGGQIDLAAAPRRALVVTLQLAIVLIIGLPFLAFTQPFLPGLSSAAVFVVLLVVLGFAFWRSAANLQGHVRAGAEMIVEILTTQARKGASSINGPDGQDLSQVWKLLPGLGAPVTVRLSEASSAVGRTLAQLNLRGQTGATVLAILRGDTGIIVPTANEVLCPGDVLALAGTHDAIEGAKAVLA